MLKDGRYAVYNLKPSKKGMEKHLSAVFAFKDGNFHLLEDHGNVFAQVHGEDGKKPSELLKHKLHSLMTNSSYVKVVPTKEDNIHSQERRHVAEIELPDPHTGRQIFSYKHASHSGASPLVFEKGSFHLNGYPLSMDELHHLRKEVESGNAAVTYPDDMFKAEEDLAKATLYHGTIVDHEPSLGAPIMKITIENHNEDKVQEYQGSEEEVKQSLLKDFPWLFNAEAPSDLRDMVLEINSSQMYSVVGIQPKQFANAVAQRMEEDPEEEAQPSSDAPAEPLPEGDFFDQDYLNPEISNMHAYRQFVANDPHGYHIYLASDSIKETLEKEGVKQHNDILIAIAKMINQSASTTEEQGKTFRIGHDAYYVYFPSKTGALKFLYNLNAIVNEIPTLYSVHPYFDVGVGDSMENAYHAVSQVQHMKVPNKDKGNHVVLHTEEGTRYLSPEDNDAAGMIKSEPLNKP
jgi:hypothetical protein